MNLFCDILLIVIIVLAALVGRRRGFVKTVFSFFGSLLAFVAAFFLASPVGAFLEERIFLPHLTEDFLSSLEKAVGSTRGSLNFSALPESETVTDLLRRFGTNSGSVAAASGGKSTAEAVAQKVVSPLAHLISVALAFFLVFILVSLLLKLIGYLLDLVAKIPGLKFSNRLLGFLAGLVWGLFLAVLISSLLSGLAPYLRSSDIPFFASFDPEKTYVLRLFRHFDFLGAVQHILIQKRQ